MIRFLAARVALLGPTLLGVLMVTFLLLYVAPGDPVQAMVGERADAETIARLRAELHLDDPLPVQFARYVGGVVRGDLGTSYITRRPILTDLLHRFPGMSEFDQRAQEYELTYLKSSHHAQAALAEQYAGMPFEDAA